MQTIFNDLECPGLPDLPDLPDLPHPNGIEHEKWKSMVDSVIEFIAASRTMLQALNDRMHETEVVETSDKIDEEEIDELEKYEEFVESDLTPEQETKEALEASSVKIQDEVDKNSNKDDDKRSVSVCGLQMPQPITHCKKFVSRIPRTKSCMDERNKCKYNGLERNFNEGSTIGRCHRNRKAEVGYSTIYQKGKTSKESNTLHE